MNYSKTKIDASMTVEAARTALVEKLKDTQAYRDLVAELVAFQNDAEKKGTLLIDEYGLLVCEMSISLDDVLCTDENELADSDLARAVLEAARPEEHFYITKEQGTRDASNWRIGETYGEFAIVNARPERNCYAVYSDDLKLKIMKIESEEHGLLLVEQAMRKHGVFGDVVSTDYNGFPSRLSISKEVRDASDAELTAMIDAIENEGENE